MAENNSEKTVLVTGGTGFVGVHCVLQLLQQGYSVKTTVRFMSRKDKVTAMLKQGGVVLFDRLSFIEADLGSDTNWDEAAKGCTYVLHVASPISLRVPEDENEMIHPAVEGTLRVLRASKKAGVKRVVMTSTMGAIYYGHAPTIVPFNENQWSNLDHPSVGAYVKSKTLAEKAAWDFIRNEGGSLELSVINPAAIFGPALGTDFTTSLGIISNLLNGKTRAVPQVGFGIVDVRDVATLHIRAMTSPDAAGQRFAVQADSRPLALHEIALILKHNMGEAAARVTVKVLPNWLVRVAALFNAQARLLAPQLGTVKYVNNEKTKSVLNWKPISPAEAVLASARSVIELNR